MVAFAEYWITVNEGQSIYWGNTRTQRTFIARELALGAGAVVWIPADTADVVVGHVPAPGGDRVPFSYGDLHLVLSYRCFRRYRASVGGMEEENKHDSC